MIIDGSRGGKGSRTKLQDKLPRHCKFWTESENNFLIQNSSKYSIDELSKMFERTHRAVKNRLISNSLKWRGKKETRHFNTDFFKVWSSNMAYVLGYWFADGDIEIDNRGSHRFSISSNDGEHLERIKYLMSSNHSLKQDKRHKKINYILAIGSTELFQDIVKLGGCERKSLVLKFPSVPQKFIKNFILGYFDGDGHVSSSRDVKISFTGTKEFLTKLQTYLPYLGKINLIKNKTYSLIYDVEYAREILDYLYSGADIFLERKYKIYLESKNWRRQRKLRSDSMLLAMNGYPRSYAYSNSE